MCLIYPIKKSGKNLHAKQCMDVGEHREDTDVNNIR